MFEIDISEVIAAEERAKAELRQTAKLMLSVAQVSALEERSTHAYNNRTGLLEKNTQARIDQPSSDGAVVELVMDREYASYVVGRGLSNIEEEARNVERGIEIVLEAQAKRIAGAT